MSNAGAQDGHGCSVSIAVGWVALSQSGDFTACRGVALRWEAEGAGCWPAGLTLSATPRCGSSQETKARNLHKVSNVEALTCLSLLPSLWFPWCSLGWRETGLTTLPFLMSSYPMLLCSFSTELRATHSYCLAQDPARPLRPLERVLLFLSRELYLEPA